MRIPPALHLNVDEQPGLVAVAPPDPCELVDVPPAGLRVSHDLLQLLIQELEPARPVDTGVNGREAEREERLEVVLERLLPGAVVIGVRLAHALRLLYSSTRANRHCSERELPVRSCATAPFSRDTMSSRVSSWERSVSLR